MRVWVGGGRAVTPAAAAAGTERGKHAWQVKGQTLHFLPFGMMGLEEDGEEGESGYVCEKETLVRYLVQL